MESDSSHASNFDFAVLEMGMNHKGEIAALARIAPPNVGVVTAVAPVHLEFFSSIDEIAEAKSELITGIVPGGLVVLNADDERVARMDSLRFDIISRTFGIEHQADVMAHEILSDGIGKSSFTLITPRGEISARVPLSGRHNIYNALAAAAVADHYETPLREIADALSVMQAPKMRGEVVRFHKGFTLVDDSYNSSPRALLEMVSTIAASRECRRRIVVAGEMLELGELASQLHHDAGRRIAQLGIDKLIGVRGFAREIVSGAREAGMVSDAAVFAQTPEEAAEVVIREVREGDLILVKGSRGVRTEIVVERLKQKFETLEDCDRVMTGDAASGRC
jgi:UDP-N-acetylmuramoyl-tripeptide--D-alanyl-D-alanine ligase